jgi:hypothetical protein
MRLGRRLGAAALPCLVVVTAALSGCTGSSQADDAPTSASPSATAEPDPVGGQTSAPVLDPAHAVEKPGPRRGAVQLPDIIVNGSDPIDDQTVETIRAMKGVQDVEVISLAQVVIENEALWVAAVDPATYRNYTPANVADTQEVWDRVADGELALRPALEKKLPMDKQGFLRLGSAEGATPVHIGAYAPLSEQVDAVVNETWVKTLDMTPDNALLVRTGSTAPLTLRTPIERAVGSDPSVQMVDAVARSGIDPDVVQTAVVVGTIADAVGVFDYTVIGGGRIAPDPAWVASHIATETVPILGNVTCNKLIFPQLKAALSGLQAQGLADEIDPAEYAGCYYPRFIAGTTTLSNHSFGLALDFNVPGNQRGTVGEMDRSVVEIFKRWGFAWGGDWRYTDPMHFEMNTLVDPR